MAARHGFRVSELCELRWDQVDLRAGLIHVSRKKNGVPSTHPLSGDEVRALRQLRRDWPDGRQVFVTERGAPFTRSGFAKMVARAGEAAGFAFPVHMHMLRHACGYYYANRGEDTRSLQLWLGVDPTHGKIHAAERRALQGLVAIAYAQLAGISRLDPAARCDAARISM